MLWREVVYEFLVNRRRTVLDAIREGFNGFEAPHPIVQQLRSFSFSERREIVSGTSVGLDKILLLLVYLYVRP